MTLADQLAALSDEQLAELLLRRPDLCERHHGHPVPSFGDLADRAGRWSSQAALLVRLNRFERSVLDLALLCGARGTVADAVTMSGGVLDTADASDGLEALAGVGLVWFDDDGSWHVAGQIRSQYLHPCGLGRRFARLASKVAKDEIVGIALHLGVATDLISSSQDNRPGRGGPVKEDYVDAIVSVLSDRQQLEAVLESCPDAELVDAYTAALERQVPAVEVGWGFGASVRQPGPRGRHSPAPARPDPADWLLKRGLLMRGSATNLAEIPLEVGVAFRGGRPIPVIERHPPMVLAVSAGPPGAVGAATTAAAMALIESVTGLLHEIEADPVKANKGGGVGVRAVRTLAKRLDRDERDVARLLELCDLADLVEHVWQRDGARVRHGSRAATWLAARPAEQWLALVHDWYATRRIIGSAGGRDTSDSHIAPIGRRTTYLTGIDDARRRLVRALADLPEDQAAEPGSLRGSLGFEDPIFEASNPDITGGGTLFDVLAAEADLLGVRAAGGAGATTRALAAGDWDAALAAASDLLPEVVDQLVVQADLTVVAPGPVSAAITRMMGAMADVESRGGATTWRLSEASVRRALDAGYTAGMLHEVLESHAHGDVPQPVRYLIDDIARRYGTLRVREAGAVIRCPDEALLAEVAAHRKLRSVLALVAPTVAVASVGADELLGRLRDAAFLPVLEDAAGEIVFGGAGESGAGDERDDEAFSRRTMLRRLAEARGEAPEPVDDLPWWRHAEPAWVDRPPDVDSFISSLRRPHP